MTLFDRYVVVDWSANNAPKVGKDSIWIADLGEHGACELDNPPTRREAMVGIKGIFRRAFAEGERVLAGFDAPLGYPRGLASKLELRTEPAWLVTWEELADVSQDDDRNRNNRFEVAALLNTRVTASGGPFWGCPKSAPSAALCSRKNGFVEYPCAGLAEFRAAELAVARPSKRPKSVWQLLGAGTVGGQTLTLVPLLARLRASDGLVGRVRIWPFETGFVPDPCGGEGPAIVLAEVWPSALPDDVVARCGHAVKDANQVDALARHLRDVDRSGQLAEWFEQCGVDDASKRTAIEEEGWILWSN